MELASKDIDTFNTSCKNLVDIKNLSLTLADMIHFIAWALGAEQISYPKSQVVTNNRLALNLLLANWWDGVCIVNTSCCIYINNWVWYNNLYLSSKNKWPVYLDGLRELLKSLYLSKPGKSWSWFQSIVHSFTLLLVIFVGLTVV